MAGADWEAFEARARALGYALGPAERERIEALLARIAEGARRTALTRITDPAEALELHVLDALEAAAALEPHPLPDTIVDLGSGAGLPALPLAIALPAHRGWRDRQPPRWTLLESVGKKCAFLRETIRALGLEDSVEVVCERAERFGHDPARRERFDLATARALAPLPVLLEYALPLVRPGGALPAWKGPRAREEIAASATALEQLGGGAPPSLLSAVPGRSLCFVRVPKLRPTPARYPRRVGVPRKRPLGGGAG
ncbi:MAG: 16S rRNA (guanine(527)-N(7))-methyltransferase RsmG [Planctomycetota bacterium]|nr:MAG: 16S rRNA (guanine(527)-N(7))-methyltransferase RsmG [Planctomycetota bacterium]